MSEFISHECCQRLRGLNYKADAQVLLQLAKTRCQFHKHFNARNLRLKQNKLVHGSMHSTYNVAYFARAASYTSKMFMKLTTTGVNVT